ncbi:MAG TPA: mycofactocin biosynthesis glycosyltransferase MftF [Mycobacteriales bacterium]|nr:mycofactocin biosynthesis glycosyltransferase MftF [Mycobacteriales bacterium]
MTVTPLPERLDVTVDRDTRELPGGRLVGGTPRRMLRLSETGRAALAELRRGTAVSPAARQLGRRMTDAGLAHPAPAAAPAVDVTVVVPVRDRVEALDRCLASIGGAHCVVVDDGSHDAAAVAAVVRRHGARLIRREVPGGPAVARNAALRRTSTGSGIGTELVAFLDSDCVAPPSWVERLAGHFADPLVGAVAPRVVPAGRAGSKRFGDRVGLLDLGTRPARVQPLGRIAFVPTAALVVRRSALEASGGEFDAALRYGEDVDLVWRLDAAGWRVRYDPAVEVAHDEAAGYATRLARRFRYGTAAAPLAKRHPHASAHLVGSPWPFAAVAGVLTGRRAVAVAGAAGTLIGVGRALRRADAGELSAATQGARTLAGTWHGTGRYATQFGLPLLAAAAWRGGTRRAVTLAALVATPPVVDWYATRPGVPLTRYVAGRIPDDAAYGAGVYAGCVKERTAAPLRVVISRRAGERKPR